MVVKPTDPSGSRARVARPHAVSASPTTVAACRYPLGARTSGRTSSRPSMRPGSCAVNAMPSSPGSVPGSRSLSSSTVWNPVAAMPPNLGGLPEADHVALGVLHVGAEAHVADRSLAQHGLATELADPLQRLVDARDVDHHQRPGRRADLAAEHAAVDVARLGGAAVAGRPGG